MTWRHDVRHDEKKNPKKEVEISHDTICHDVEDRLSIPIPTPYSARELEWIRNGPKLFCIVVFVDVV